MSNLENNNQIPEVSEQISEEINTPETIDSEENTTSVNQPDEMESPSPVNEKPNQPDSAGSGSTQEANPDDSTTSQQMEGTASTDIPLDLSAPDTENAVDWSPVYAAADDQPINKKKKHRGLLIGLIIAGVVLIGGAGGATAAGYHVLKEDGAFIDDIFYANTMINGIDCSGMNVDQVYDAITLDLGSYSLTVQERGGSEAITGAQIDLAERPDREAIQQILSTQSEMDYIELIKQSYGEATYEISLIRSYDEDLANSCIDALACLDSNQMIAPVDSQLIRDGNQYRITEAVAGTTLDAQQARAAIATALAAYEESVDLDALGFYSNPVITEDDVTLNAQLSQIQTLLSASITYDFSDRTYVCDNSVIIDFLIQNEDGSWTIDENLVHAWVDQMAEETDTYRDHDFTTHSGNLIHLAKGNYGWSLYRDTTTASLVEKILAGTVETTTPEYYHSNAKTRATNDIGDDYVEIDLTNQKVYLYVDGECIFSTSCVSGLARDPDRITPTNGVWALSYKKSPAVLGRMEVQGYESPVTYWMPFNGGVGLHDATWRSSFGGTIYKTNGSHGCINLPLDAARTIYNNISAGWPIIVYGS